MKKRLRESPPLSQYIFFEVPGYYITEKYPTLHKIATDISLVMNAVGFKTNVCDKHQYQKQYLALSIENPIYFNRISEIDNPEILQKPAAEFSDDFTIKKLYDAFDEKMKISVPMLCKDVDDLLNHPYATKNRGVSVNCSIYAANGINMMYCALKIIELLKAQGYKNIEISRITDMPSDCYFKTKVDSFVINI